MEPLAAATLLFCSTAQPGPYPPAAAVVDAFFEAYNRHDIAGVRQLFTEDAVIDAGYRQISGRELVGGYEDIVFPRFPKVRIEMRDRLASTDLVAQMEWSSLTGAGKGEEGLTVYRVKNGCIVAMTLNLTD